MLKLANRIAKFCAEHRKLLWGIQYNLQELLQLPPQDAVTALRAPTECPSRSHLGCALFRANGVPARVVLAMPTRYKFWFEMHYMTEYYLNDFGWVLTEAHHGVTPYPPQEQIILRICYPEDENNTQADYMYLRMKGIERWMWFDNESVKPYYVDCIEGSKMKSFAENSVMVDSDTANATIDLTSEVFDKYQYYLGLSLVGENQDHFETAIDYIESAIEEFDNSDDTSGYMEYLNLSNDEFDLITI